jgi:hypothetical protein
MKLRRIDYNGGYLKKGQLYWRTIHNSIDTCIHDNQVFENEYPIVGQTNLSIPNIPYIEEGEDIESEAKQLAEE